MTISFAFSVNPKETEEVRNEADTGPKNFPPYRRYFCKRLFRGTIGSASNERKDSSGFQHDFISITSPFFCSNRQELLAELRDSAGPEINMSCKGSCKDVLDMCDVTPPDIQGSETNVYAKIPYSAWECVALNPDVQEFGIPECGGWPLSLPKRNTLPRPKRYFQTIYKVDGTPVTGNAANVQIENGRAKVRLKGFQ